MDSATEYWTARALLEWQVEMGADEAMLDAPLNRYELPDTLAKPAAKPAASVAAPVAAKSGPKPVPVIPDAVVVDTVALAKAAAAPAQSVAELAAALAAFEHCELKKGARNFVLAEGDPTARVMVIAEAPVREDDLEGRPFVGSAGQLLDRMLAAINLGRAHDQVERRVYITHVLPWRLPATGGPSAEDLAMMLPFLQRHIELVDPDVIVLLGNTPCQALLGQGGVTRLRGTWQKVLGRPALPMQHPAELLASPERKRDAWADLLALNARLKSPK